MKSQTLADSLLGTLLEKERLESSVKELNLRIAEDEIKLHEAMIDEGLDSLKIKGIEFKPIVDRSFVFAEQFKGNQWDSDLFFGWLRKVKADGIIKTKESVHAQTRNKFLKDWVDDKKPLPEFIAETFHPTVKYNKSAVERLSETGS